MLSLARALGVSPLWLETGKGGRDVVPAPENIYVAAESIEDLALQMLDKGSEEIAKLLKLIIDSKSHNE